MERRTAIPLADPLEVGLRESGPAVIRTSRLKFSVVFKDNNTPKGGPQVHPLCIPKRQSRNLTMRGEKMSRKVSLLRPLQNSANRCLFAQMCVSVDPRSRSPALFTALAWMRRLACLRARETAFALGDVVAGEPSFNCAFLFFKGIFLANAVSMKVAAEWNGRRLLKVIV